MEHQHFYHHNQYQQAYANELAKIEFSISGYYCHHNRFSNGINPNHVEINKYSEHMSNVNEPRLSNDQLSNSSNYQMLENDNSSLFSKPFNKNNVNQRPSSVASDFSIDSLTSNCYNNTSNINNENNNLCYELLSLDSISSKSCSQYTGQQSISNYQPKKEFDHNSNNLSNDYYLNKHVISNDASSSNCSYHDYFNCNNSSIDINCKNYLKLPNIKCSNLLNGKIDCKNYTEETNIPNFIIENQVKNNFDYSLILPNQSILKQHMYASSPNVVDRSFPSSFSSSSSSSSASSSFCNYDYHNNNNYNNTSTNNEQNFCLNNQMDQEINNNYCFKEQQNEILPISNFDFLLKKSPTLSFKRRQKSINFQNIDFQYPTNPSINKNIKVKLEDSELWTEFNRIGTEMLITKPGRRMFPFIRYRVSGLEKRKNYIMFIDIVMYDKNRYKFASNEWLVINRDDANHNSGERCFIHPDSPMNGESWMKQIISFNKIKLTNNKEDKSGYIILSSMHKYIPRLHIVEEGKSVNTFLFRETSFMAVTSYQNSLITKLKIDNNPFARGFRDCQKRRNKREAKHIDDDDNTSLNDSIDLITPLVI